MPEGQLSDAFLRPLRQASAPKTKDGEPTRFAHRRGLGRAGPQDDRRIVAEGQRLLARYKARMAK